MKKELFKIFENFTITDISEEVVAEIVNDLNNDSATLNSMFLSVLEVLEKALTGLNENEVVIANSHVEYILAMEFTAKAVQLIMKHKKHLIKLEPTVAESIKLNTSSIINAVETISKLQAERLKSLEPEELLIALTT